MMTTTVSISWDGDHDNDDDHDGDDDHDDDDESGVPHACSAY